MNTLQRKKRNSETYTLQHSMNLQKAAEYPSPEQGGRGGVCLVNSVAVVMKEDSSETRRPKK